MIDKQWGSPTITNDGVTIAREIELEIPTRTSAHSWPKKLRPRPTM